MPADAPCEHASSRVQQASLHHHWQDLLWNCSEFSGLQALAELVRSGTDDVRISALETVGNLSFQVENRVIFLADAELLEWIYRLARDQVHLCNFPALHSVLMKQWWGADKSLTLRQETRPAKQKSPLKGLAVRHAVLMTGGGFGQNVN